MGSCFIGLQAAETNRARSLPRPGVSAHGLSLSTQVSSDLSVGSDQGSIRQQGDTVQELVGNAVYWSGFGACDRIPEKIRGEGLPWTVVSSPGLHDVQRKHPGEEHALVCRCSPHGSWEAEKTGRKGRGKV